MYHRVAHAPVDPWHLAVRPETFERQMAYIARTRRPVHLDWLAAELRAGRKPRGTVAVTFDDAYRDVLENAWPVLVRHQVPATVYVVSGAIGSETGYWWDILAELVLGRSDLPTELRLPVPAPEAEVARQRGDREALHRELSRALRYATKAELDLALDAVAQAYGNPEIRRAPVMTEHELHRIREGDLVRLGVHTVTHPRLSSLTAARQREELLNCREAVERIVGGPVGSMAYPFGDHDDTTIDVTRSLGFDHAVGVDPGQANDWSHRFALPRLYVGEWSLARFARTLAVNG
jgi:peptidoglycan/xylan/chitin deacetylase (PgdA/CDA1 family)